MKKLLLSIAFLLLLSTPVLADNNCEDSFKGIIGTTAYVTVNVIDFDSLRNEFLRYERLHVDKVVIDLFSFGGSLFDAMAIGALIEEQEKGGRVVEIRARGIVASAGLLIMISGSKGHRLIDKNALVMWHELSVTKFLVQERPSDQEEEAKVNRMIQDNVNNYMASRTLMKKEEITERIKKKEFWMTAQDAIKYGFADSLIGGDKK